MTDYANEDVDRLRIIAKYCNGTEHDVFLTDLADRMEEVVADVVRPVFTREDVKIVRGAAGGYGSGDFIGKIYGQELSAEFDDLADRIEQALPIEHPVEET